MVKGFLAEMAAPSGTATAGNNGGYSGKLSSAEKENSSAKDDEQYSQQEIVEEREHFKAVVNAFLYYK